MLSDEQVRDMVMRNKRLIYHIAIQHGPIGVSCDTDDVAQAMFVEAFKVLHRYESARLPEASFICMVMWRFLERERRKYRLREFDSGDMEFEAEPETLHVSYFRAIYEELRKAIGDVSDKLVPVLDMLLETGGNQVRAIERLGMGKRTIERAVSQIRTIGNRLQVAEAF